jgi:hypothetical protein
MSVKKMDVLRSVGERSFNQQETIQLLKLKPIWLMSWAARNFTTFGDKVLFFVVSGCHHKGIVLITLAWDDTYTVRLLSNQWNEKAKFVNVYFDELAELIDTKVERIKDYTN